MYSASKWAVRGLTESFRVELKDTNIKVLSFYPIGTKTNIFNSGEIPPDYDTFMSSDEAANLIINNLEKDSPLLDLFVG